MDDRRVSGHDESRRHQETERYESRASGSGRGRERDEPRRERDRDSRRHRSRSRDRREDERRHRDEDKRRDDRRSRSRSRSRSRTRSRSRSRSPSRRHHFRHDDEKNSRPHKRSRRRRSASSDSSASESDSDSESEGERRRRRRKEKERRRDREEKEERRRRKEKKREKKARREKGTAASTAKWGQYGLISEADITKKDSEFRAWLVEERKINPETVSKDRTKKEFAVFIEDYNTATLPHEKYYDMSRYELKMNMIRSGQTMAETGGYDPLADMRAHSSGLKSQTKKEDTLLTREQVAELRRLEAERIEVAKRRQLGLNVPKNLGVRTEEFNPTTFD
ncbi:hypothetical protein IAU60_005663 [Kwoniella sp. DSM 27419]